MNNKYFIEKCPALMNNNRNFTSFILNSELNQNLYKELKCKNEHDYRKLLQDNTDNIIEKYKNEYSNIFSCNVPKK